MYHTYTPSFSPLPARLTKNICVKIFSLSIFRHASPGFFVQSVMYHTSLLPSLLSRLALSCVKIFNFSPCCLFVPYVPRKISCVKIFTGLLRSVSHVPYVHSFLLSSPGSPDEKYPALKSIYFPPNASPGFFVQSVMYHTYTPSFSPLPARLTKNILR